MKHLVSVLVALAVAAPPLALCDPVTAQKSAVRKYKRKGKYKKEYWKTDPYTGNDEARMKAAGYVSFGPFAWGDDHDSSEIKKMFPEIKVLVVETKHFKIACSLPEYTLPKTAKLEKKLLKQDLTELKKIFPEIKPTRRTLDPWLRLHLMAMRLERTFDDFCKRIKVEDADFPQTASTRISTAGARAKRFDKSAQERSDSYMGQGPHLGMRGKFLIMMLTKGAHLNRYVARARPGVTIKGNKPYRYYFRKIGSLYFGTTCEAGEGDNWNDHALHCHTVFNVIQSLMDGYKDFFFTIPVWSREGLSHWYLRRIDPKKHCFTGMKGRTNKKRYDHKWDISIKKRVGHGDFTPAAKLMKYMSFDDLTFGDHLAVWSRMDYLQSLGNDKFAKFMGILKGKIEVASGQVPKVDRVIEQQERALQQAYGFDYAGFDRAWAEWVKKTYKSR